MPLRPENNTLYWQYLLTDPLYLLPQDLVINQQSMADSQQEAQAPAASDAPAAPKLAAAPPQQAATAASAQEAAGQPAAEADAAQPDLLWGSLHRGVLILVDYPGHALMDRPDGMFLVDILKAMGYEFKEVATLNISRCKTPADWAWVRQQPWQKLISFGVQHTELPYTLQTVPYTLNREAGRPVIQVDPLPQIRSDVALKKQLWNLLKQYFV